MNKYILLLVITIMLCLCILGIYQQPALNDDMSIEMASRNKTSLGTFNNNLPWWDGGGDCSCNKSSGCVAEEHHIYNHEDPVNGSCGRRTWHTGPQQRIVSYTLFGNNPQYWEGFEQNILSIAKFYPGYQVWLYTDPRGRKEVLCPLLKIYNNVFICDVQNLPFPIGDISKIHPAMWRYAPIGDPNIDVLLFRDSDSEIIGREVSAVKEWLRSSNDVIHVMRDHPGHTAAIMAGCWDLRVNTSLYSYEYLANLRSHMFKMASRKNQYGLDQKILKGLLYRKMRRHSLSHDSFQCKKYPNSRPWPTKREYGEFVGSPIFRRQFKDANYLHKVCPIECRPQLHKDWIFC